MHICIDSSVFVRGFSTDDANIAVILDLIGRQLTLMIPRLVAIEVTRNLATVERRRQFYALFRRVGFATIIDAEIPIPLVEKYTALGLPAKADAFIGAFAEWQSVSYLLSDNRHFLRRLQTSAFTVLTPDEFIGRWQQNEL